MGVRIDGWVADTLADANSYGSHLSKYNQPGKKKVDMDKKYPAIPASNVGAIIDGYNACKSGTLCTSPSRLVTFSAVPD